MNPQTPPSVSVLTAPGRGAVAVIRAWGYGAVGLADRAFRPHRGRPLAASPRGRLRVGRVGAGLGDEVVAVVVEGGPPEVEFQCHGGPAAVELVVEALVDAGASARDARAWARQSLGSTIRAEAATSLTSASTVRAAEILFEQAEGAFDDEIRRALDDEPGSAIARIDALIDRASVGLKLVEGWRVVLAGRPNVGKSRLLNALAGYDRSIVDPTAGTTRDVVTAGVAFDGWPVELADTAGLRESPDPIEAEGVARALDRQRRADLVLVVLDRSEPLDDLDRSILLVHPEALIVANKSDLPGRWDESAIGARPVSAERGDGIDGLVRAIAARLVPKTPPPGSGVPFLPRHLRRLAAIRARFAAGRADRGRRSLARWIGRGGLGGVPEAAGSG